MTIGILTFHWGTNHGAVLQAYASMKYLQEQKQVDNVQIIDYYPKSYELNIKQALRLNYPDEIIRRIRQIQKEKKICGFRKRLNLTKRYYANQELIDSSPDFDVLVCGSDQVWNPSFAMRGEGKPTPVYFLNFGETNCKKIALSVSFGCSKYPADAEAVVKPYIEKFDAISVRENTGLAILKKMGIFDAAITADPTALLSREHYQKLCNTVHNEKVFVAKCILRKQSKASNHLIRQVVAAVKSGSVKNIVYCSMEDWLSSIRDANIVVTNSFHCIMMCLKLHTPFVSILEDGTKAGMNDRIETLMEYFGMKDRIINSMSKNYDSILHKDINWGKIDELMDKYASTLKLFIARSLF